MGPEGGDGGGEIVAQGTPQDIKKAKKSYTAKYL
jgi:excinuclease ABC subunit A